jgi:hypothetical protein
MDALVLNFALFIRIIIWYIFPVLFAEGRLPVTFGGWSRMRRPRTRPRQPECSGASGLRPTGTKTRARGVR